MIFLGFTCKLKIGNQMVYGYVKRLTDISISLIALCILSPLLIVFSVFLYFANKGAGVYFTQSRPGKKGKIFSIIKFKTMTDELDKNGKLLPDEKRLTKIGQLVRSLSIDELPQLINVLKGDMSLVGPRPLLPKYLPLYNQRQARRHEVRPGITGWSQVNGRNSISWEQKFEMDVWYVENISFWLDMKILWLTLIKVFKREGISAQGSVSGIPFTANSKGIDNN
jgi:lipopolysaccharide/colanic/teichoic acid biosynthesis glycosyltransferase